MMNLSSAGALGLRGPAGADGASAYEIAVAGGYAGTQAQWLASLRGEQGPEGPAGSSGTGTGGGVSLGLLIALS